jgi:retinol dehydrogenase-12
MSLVAIVTGANVGIGKETARGLIGKGYHVIIACRDAKKAEAAAEELNRGALSTGSGEKGHCEVGVIDLADLASVKLFCTRFVARGLPLHALVLNGGLNTIGMKPPPQSAQGLELCFAVNYLGHFLMVELLLEVMKRTAAAGGAFPVRIVALSSVTHYQGRTDWEFLSTNSRGKSYSTSKLALTVMVGSLGERLAGTGVEAVAVNPGAVASDIWRNTPFPFTLLLKPIMWLLFLTPEQGAATSLAAATRETAFLAQGPTAGKPVVYLQPYYPAFWLGSRRWMAELLGPFAGARHGLCLDKAMKKEAQDSLQRLSRALCKDFL